MTSFSEIARLSAKGNVIPLVLRVSSDLDTPVSAYMKLAGRSKVSFLLESVEGGEKLARYSFLGFDPFLLVTGDRDSVVVSRGQKQETIAAPSIDFLRELFSVYRPVGHDDLPRFTGGGVGYFSYDAVRWVERVPDANPDRIGLPEMMMGLYDRIVVFDHLKQELVLVANILHEGNKAQLRVKYEEAKQKLEQMQSRLSRPTKASARPVTSKARPGCNLEPREFEKMVRKAKQYIKEGDIFQVVLSRRWTVNSRVDPLTVYRRLRRTNPSPYLFLLTFGKQAIIGSSPEMMVRVEHGEIETRPIAGTRPRGKNEIEDARMQRELLSDPKELAEHTMLLDLGRNDIGRVSRPGTVQVKDRMIVEKYSHVMHIVSSVAGKLEKKRSPLDGHFACFPAGTVSGAPKIRAMEIIDELEPERRGVYAGSIAYLDFWGNLDSCIAIRTVVRDGDSYFIQAGAGIVADSRPSREVLETEAKAEAALRAVIGD